MCGIAGYLNLNGSPLDPESSCLPAMLRSIEHRGPDEEGSVITGPVALGMTRLSIIDLKTGQQPIYNEDGSVVIVFNGEIYNFQELRDELIAAGHVFKTESDTETIVHLYEEHGVGCLEHLEGMFAFAIWDKREERLFLARDRMGEKPLHWGVFNGQLVFGSEIKSLFDHPGTRKALNPEALRQYLALEYVPAPASMFAGINKLQPAHFMLVENGQTRIERYWQSHPDSKPYNDSDAMDELEDLLNRSIKLRLISDVPLGIFLSGGIDSSLIAALAARHVSKPLQTFSIGFSDRSFDESDHARTVADFVGTRHKVLTFQPQLAQTMISDLWEYLDEPIADASIVPTFSLARMTRQSVTVALSGEGGDELFGGYPTYLAHRLAGVYNKLPAPLRSGLIEPLVRNLPVSLNNLSFDYKAKRFIASAACQPLSRQLRWMGSLPIETHESILKPDLLAGSGIDDEIGLIPHLTESLSANGAADIDIIELIMRMDQSTYLADDLLVKSDRSTMAASLEARLPFLAYPLVEFAHRLPASHKLRGKTSKYLLRRLSAGLLPDSIISRPKKGFGIPVAKWIRSDLKHVVDRLLGREFIESQGIFQWSGIDQLVTGHHAIKSDRRKEIWTLLMFQWWWCKFFLNGEGLPDSESKRTEDFLVEA